MSIHGSRRRGRLSATPVSTAATPEQPIRAQTSVVLSGKTTYATTSTAIHTQNTVNNRRDDTFPPRSPPGGRPLLSCPVRAKPISVATLDFPHFPPRRAGCRLSNPMAASASPFRRRPDGTSAGAETDGTAAGAETDGTAAPSTATGHLDRLLDGRLVVQQRQGRHRYVRLAGPDAAGLVESLAAHAGPETTTIRSLRSAYAASAVAAARTCYDHLAGRLGVAVTDALTRKRRLDLRNGCTLTDAGVTWFDTALGVDLAAARASRRPVALSCVDWTERRPHLAGLAGAQLCGTMIDRGWLARVPGTRAVRLTAAGGPALCDLLGPEVGGSLSHTAAATG